MSRPRAGSAMLAPGHERGDNAPLEFPELAPRGPMHQRKPLTLLLTLALSLAVTPAAAEPLEYPCVIEPDQVVNVSTALEGVLASMEVSKGDRVEQGQVLARLQSEVEEAAVEQARARVEMRAALRARQARLERARSKYRRAQELSDNQYVSPDELDELASEVAVAELDLLAEREKIDLARLELARVEAQLAMRAIRSPIRGLVTDRLLAPGEFAQAQPILTVARLDPLRVEVVLPASVYGAVREGMTATVLPADPIGGALEAEVVLVEQVIDAASATFGVRLALPNPDYQLPAGLECEVRFPAP